MWWAYRRFCWFWRCGSYWRTEAFSHAAMALLLLGISRAILTNSESRRRSSRESKRAARVWKERERDLYSEISSAFTRNWWLPMNISWSEGLCSCVHSSGCTAQQTKSALKTEISLSQILSMSIPLRKKCNVSKKDFSLLCEEMKSGSFRSWMHPAQKYSHTQFSP